MNGYSNSKIFSTGKQADNLVWVFFMGLFAVKCF